MTTLPDNGWFIGGGARHSAAMMRVMAGIATGGRPGVIQSGDLAVTATTPGSMNVNVAPGGVVVPGPGLYEAYVNRLQNTQVIPITPGGIYGRSDMIVIGVQDPAAGGRPLNAGETMEDRLCWEINVIRSVSSSATRLSDLTSILRPRYPAIPLARIDVPPSGSSPVILNGHIVPLTQLSPVRSLTLVRPVKTTIPATTPGPGAGMARWPNVTQTVTIPDWASHMTATVTLVNIAKDFNTPGYDGALYLYRTGPDGQVELEVSALYGADTTSATGGVWAGHATIVTPLHDVRHLRNQTVSFETRVVTPVGATSALRASANFTVSRFEFHFESS